MSKCFRNATRNSRPIKEKLPLRQRSKPLTKVMVWGVQYTASPLNPLFAPGILHWDLIMQNKRLKDRRSEDERFGITMGTDSRIPMESSILDTYLLEAPFKKIVLNVCFWVGEEGPAIVVSDVDVGPGEAMTIRDMVDVAVDKHQKIGLAFDIKKWRRDSAVYPPVPHDHRRQPYEGPRENTPGGCAHIRDNPVTLLNPRNIVWHMNKAKKAGKPEQWRCDTFAKPSTVIRHLQVAAGPGYRVYVGLSQVDRLTFMLKDVQHRRTGLR